MPELLQTQPAGERKTDHGGIAACLAPPEPIVPFSRRIVASQGVHQ